MAEPSSSERSTRYPVFSIVMPTYNQCCFLQEAIESVLLQSFENFELIIVDNFSSDNTKVVVESFKDPRIFYRKFRNNGVIGASRNTAISLAKGDYVAFLDSDDLWHKEKLAHAFQMVTSGFDFIFHGFATFGNGLKEKSYIPSKQCCFYSGALTRHNSIATSAVVIKRSLLKKAGLFSEDPSLSTAEDYDLWLKVLALTPRVRKDNRVLTKLRMHGSNNGRSLKQINAVEKILLQNFGSNHATGISNYKRRKRFSLLKYEQARFEIGRREIGEAFRCLKEAIRLNPFNLTAILFYIYFLLARPYR